MKKRNLVTKVAIFVSIFIFAAIIPAYAGEVRGVTKDTIKIGFMTDMTGPAAANCLPWRDGLRDSFRYVNDQGGINGRKIKFLVEDDRYSIPISMAAYKKLIYKDEVLFTIGPSGTGASVALLSQINKEKVLAIVWSRAERMVVPAQKYIFNNVSTYTDMVKLIFDYIINDSKSKSKEPRIGFVCADNEFGKSGLDPARERAKSSGLKMEDVEFLDMAALDATSQILNLKRAKADYVIVHHAISQAVALLRDARRYAFNPAFIGTQTTCDDSTIGIAGRAAKGFITVQCFSSWHDKTPGMAKLREIALRYEPAEKARSFYYVEGWATPLFIADAIRRAGKDLNTESMITALESLKGFENGGITGPVTFGPDDHKALDYLKFFKADIDKKIFVPMSDWMKPKD